MELGELAFKAQDFSQSVDPNWLDWSAFIGDTLMSASKASELANRILADKLEKALRVYTPDVHKLVKRELYDVNVRWTSLAGPTTTHSARLVCIEEIKK